MPETCEANLIWDMEQCACICPPSGLCPVHYYFDTISCSCQAEPVQCQAGFFWHLDNHGVGKCLCLVQECGEAEYFDFDACSCLFVQQNCPRAGHPEDPNPSFFDQLTGTCICLPNPA